MRCARRVPGNPCPAWHRHWQGRAGPFLPAGRLQPRCHLLGPAVSDNHRVRRRQRRGDARHRRSPSVTCQPRHLHRGNGHRRRPWHSPGGRARPALCLRVGTATATAVTASTSWPCHPRLPRAGAWHPTPARTPQAGQVLIPRVYGFRADPGHGVGLGGCSREQQVTGCGFWGHRVPVWAPWRCCCPPRGQH